MKAVINAGPLIALAKLDLLHLLKTVFAELLVPEAVQHEVLAKPAPEKVRLLKAFQESFTVVPTPMIPDDVANAVAGLDDGEIAVLTVGNAQGRDALVILDDRLARRAARALGLNLTGTVGLLLAFKKRGHLGSVSSELQKLRERGYYLSTAVLDVARKLAGE